MIITKALMLALLMMAVGIKVQAQDEPEPTIVEVQEAAAPFGPYTNWQEQTIPETTHAHQGTLIDADRAVFRWVRYKSGPQACIYSMDQDGGNIGGGRECGPGVEHCGYFMEGYLVWGASGKSCTGFGIPPCGGICQ